MDGKKERQTVTVFYNDTNSTVSKAVGQMFGDLKGTFIALKVPGKLTPVYIPLSKVVRIEGGTFL